MNRWGVVIAVLVALLWFATPSRPIEAGAEGCAKTYTRAHFHAAARSTFDRAFPLERRKRTLARIIRCQRRPASRPIVREHRKRYRAAWIRRFYFERAWARVPAWLQSTLIAISGCESGGDPAAVSPGGLYRGLLQFDYGTWASVGGHGDPAAASRLEQLVRGSILYGRRGSAPWPRCGR